MDCSLSRDDLLNGMRCRGFNCSKCRDFDNNQRKKDMMTSETFNIYRSSNKSLKSLNLKDFAIKYINDKNALITLNSLQDIINLKKILGYNLVITNDFNDDSNYMQSIEIYDDYRE